MTSALTGEKGLDHAREGEFDLILCDIRIPGTDGPSIYQRLRGLLLTTPVLKDIQLVVAGVLLLLIILFIPSGAVGWLRRRLPRLRQVLP